MNVVWHHDVGGQLDISKMPRNLPPTFVNYPALIVEDHFFANDLSEKADFVVSAEGQEI